MKGSEMWFSFLFFPTLGANPDKENNEQNNLDLGAVN